MSGFFNANNAAEVSWLKIKLLLLFYVIGATLFANQVRVVRAIEMRHFLQIR